MFGVGEMMVEINPIRGAIQVELNTVEDMKGVGCLVQGDKRWWEKDCWVWKGAKSQL